VPSPHPSASTPSLVGSHRRWLPLFLAALIILGLFIWKPPFVIRPLPNAKPVSGAITGAPRSNAATAFVRELGIKTRNANQPVTALSGGNQQKVVVAKSLLTKPQVLLLDEPTRGIDVGAKAEIFQIINRLAEQGLAILFVSSELPEVLAVPDRILVLSRGRVTGEFTHNDVTEEKLVRAASALQQTDHPIDQPRSKILQTT
jgi:ABC-type sugar transport system ATPase subunit